MRLQGVPCKHGQPRPSPAQADQILAEIAEIQNRPILTRHRNRSRELAQLYTLIHPCYTCYTEP